jgi:GMP synthase (glutamine-hydrolysing)
VKPGTKKEFGKEILRLSSRQGIFKGLAAKETVWFSHGDFVSSLPRGFTRTARTQNCPNAGIYSKERNFYGIQFHPEVTHTVHGIQILQNFVFDICKAKKTWNVAGQGKMIIADLKERIGRDHVVIGISGGVDSLVAATVLHQAIGNRLHAVFVDTGLLRKNEREEVSASLRKQAFRNFHVVDARKMFLGRLAGVSDPEKKRKIIGHTFIEVFENTIRKELKKHPIKFLAQGTIYPDRIESAQPSKNASKIKSHHNLTLPAKLGFKIVEPLRDLYKDEVRALGKSLGLPADLLWRHPFPGPGLAIRVLGAVAEDRLAILREADAIYMEELKKTGEYSKIWQAFAALLPVKTVGVMGDARTYEYIISLRAVDSVDGMSADWHRIPEDLLQRISTRITSEVRGVNRVLFDITQKPPGTIEYE